MANGMGKANGCTGHVDPGADSKSKPDLHGPKARKHGRKFPNPHPHPHPHPRPTSILPIFHATNFPPKGFFENLRNRINLFIPRSIEAQLELVKHNMYTTAFLDAPDNTEAVVQPFPTNGDRFAAQEISKRSQPHLFNRRGFIAQAIAAGWHHKTPAQLGELGDRVGRERILVMHGTQDRMITFPHAEMLLRELGGEEKEVRKEFFGEMGHVIPIEKRREFNRIIEEMVEKTEGLKE